MLTRSRRKPGLRQMILFSRGKVSRRCCHAVCVCCREARLVRVGVMLSMDASVKALHMDALCKQRLKTDKNLLQTQGRLSVPPLPSWAADARRQQPCETSKPAFFHRPLTGRSQNALHRAQ